MAYSVALLFGSYSREALGGRVINFLTKRLLHQGCTPLSVNAASLDIPFLEETYEGLLKKAITVPAGLSKARSLLVKANAFILVSGEYNHLPHPGLLNLLNYFYQEYQGKTSGLVSYSIGNFGGVRTEAPLRTITSVLGMPPIAPMLSIPKANATITPDGETTNTVLLKQTDHFLDALEKTIPPQAVSKN